MGHALLLRRLLRHLFAWPTVVLVFFQAFHAHEAYPFHLLIVHIILMCYRMVDAYWPSAYAASVSCDLVARHAQDASDIRVHHRII